MNKITNSIQKLKIKTVPGKYKDLKETCKKLQAIIDRRLINQSNSKIPSYTEELYFYSIFIPDLIERMSYHDEFDDKLKMLILQAIINSWLKSNIKKCAHLVYIFDEGHLTEESPGTPGSAKSIPENKYTKKKSPVKRKSSSSKK